MRQHGPIYLAGGIAGLSDDEVFGWRAQAREALGATQVMDPSRRDYRGREDENVIELVERDKADIRFCRAMLANCTRPSWGTAMEVLYAHSDELPVVAFVGDGFVSPWLRYHATVVRGLDEGIAALR